MANIDDEAEMTGNEEQGNKDHTLDLHAKEINTKKLSKNVDRQKNAVDQSLRANSVRCRIMSKMSIPLWLYAAVIQYNDTTTAAPSRLSSV